MSFEFATAARIIFGAGKSRQLPTLARELGSRALLILGQSARDREALTRDLQSHGLATEVVLVPREPSTHLIDDLTQLARNHRADLVIAQGGGSVIDAGKAIAGLIPNPGPVLDYLEVVGGGKPLSHPGVPFLAIPTTAGTGSEVTRNSVLEVPEHRVKVSLRSPHLLARIALVDPELTLSMPPAITASTGMDALTQLIEPFVSNAANPLVDGLCREGIPRVARSLTVTYHQGDHLPARTDMALASLFGGLALANARLGAVHGFAGVLGGETGHAHGALCARLLPFVMAANIAAIQERGEPIQLARYTEIARLLTNDPTATAQNGVAWVHNLCAELAIPPLRTSGLSPNDFPRLIPLARRASSMQGNPLLLTDDELLDILYQAT